MASLVVAVTLLLLNVASVSGDTYVHLPRGNNNRLNERTATRKNGNRLFDSQNNARGGYNVGDATDRPARRDSSKQYPMEYFQSGPEYLTKKQGVSYFPIEWTNQHGCGKNNGDDDPIKLNCNMVLQFMCQKKGFSTSVPAKQKLRDGTSTDTNTYNKPNKGENQRSAQRRAKRSREDRGLNESFQSRDKCEARERNKGLFTADQKLNKNRDKAVNTRQNPGGTRRGYECPEERDYYPYWHPSEWKDIAILTEDPSRCGWYKQNSFNNKPYHECVQKWRNGATKHYSEHNNKKDCEAASGVWTAFHNYLEVLEGATKITTEQQCQNYANNLKGKPKVKWGLRMGHDKPACLRQVPEVECDVSPYTRVNHLGNSASSADDINTNTYNWKLPHFYEGDQTCVFRMRYNISTTDYPSTTDSNSNGEKKSPVTGNPKVDVGLPANQKLRLAINTAQFGRTFQDRSHIFHVKDRKALGDTADLYTLTVRGKRGNIVQTYPAVEYDFAPNNLRVSKDDLIHIQWTGSNTHNNGGNGGDGQAGDAGEGKPGTDRTNILSMKDESYNFFSTLEDKTGIAHNVDLIWADKPIKNASPIDIGVQLASGGFYSCYDCDAADSLQKKRGKKLQNQLNNAPASFAGMVVKFKKSGKFGYGCSRNNNHSNRSHKGAIIVK